MIDSTSVPAAMPAAENPSNTMALAGGIIGIVAASLTLFLWWLPFFLPTLAGVGISFSAEGMRRVGRYGYDRKGWAITGLATGIPAFVFGSAGTLFFLFLL